MKAVIQRVSSASVTEVESGTEVGKINNGLFILLGVKKGDTEANAKALSQKILKMRIFEEEKGKMDISVSEAKGSILLVSQFTLLANTKDGNRPSFIDAEAPDSAKRLYELVRDELKSEVHVETGSFGNYMQIDAQLDGPVTIVLEI